jgi:hypothetical protein
MGSVMLLALQPTPALWPVVVYKGSPYIGVETRIFPSTYSTTPRYKVDTSIRAATRRFTYPSATELKVSQDYRAPQFPDLKERF